MPAYVLEKYTYNDYKLWEGEWELIDGLQAMVLRPALKHQFIMGKIIYNLNKKLDELSCNKCFVLGEIDYIISDETVLKPDVALVCDKLPTFIKETPIAIFEIISSSTKLKDEITKKTIYQKAGIRNLFLVYPDEKKVVFNEKEIKKIEINSPCGKIEFESKEIFKGL